MISILIPAYNNNITKLVADLSKSAINSNIDFEIIVIEDGSTKFLNENSSISANKYVKYIVLDKNIGRAAIRNKLASTANGDFLIFLDCDTEIYNENFIKQYIPFCVENTVVSGGCFYKDNIDTKYSLAVKYGRKKERFSEKRKSEITKYTVFTTVNFLIDKKIFTKLSFDENFKEYGHEDTIFGINLQKAGYKLIFIDNPVYHIGLDDNFKYIEKNQLALNTLLKLYLSGDYPELLNISKIIIFFNKIKKFHLEKIITVSFNIFKKLLLQNLLSKNPSLFLFDCYKLGYLCKIYVKQKKFNL